MQKPPLILTGIPGRGVLVTFKCDCSSLFDMTITYEEWARRFLYDKKIQEAMPKRLPEFRDRFMLGQCPECYEKLNPPENPKEDAKVSRMR